MKFGVVVFPGSNCDEDCVWVLRDVLKQHVVSLWHQDTALQGCDCVILPGGFSYGDYLRTGAVARFSPIMKTVASFAKDGGLVLGICNGFQILLEAGLLPGAMLRNVGLRFICTFVEVRVERTDTPFTNRFQPGQVIRMPIAHNEGNYVVDRATLKQMHARARPPGPPGATAGAGGDSDRRAGGQVLLRYCDADGNATEAANPNGSMDSIAGICNEQGNVMGLMPHPERCSEPELGSVDGRLLFESLVNSMVLART